MDGVIPFFLPLNKNHVKKPETCQNAMERSMRGKRLSDRLKTINIKREDEWKSYNKMYLQVRCQWQGWEGTS